MPLLPSEPRKSVAEMYGKGSKRKCIFMQIKAFTHLIVLAGKFPLFE